MEIKIYTQRGSLFLVLLFLFFSNKTYTQNTLITAGGGANIKVPNLTYTQINAISSPQSGMLVFDITFKCLKYYDGTKWVCTNQSEVATTGSVINIGGLNTDYYPSMDIGNDGSIFVGGTVWNSNTYFNTNIVSQDVEDGFIAKVNPNLSLNWIKHLTGAGKNSVIGVQTDSYNNVYIYGTFQNTMVLDGITLTSTNPTPNYPDRYVAKFSSSGVLQWAIKIAVFSDFINTYDFKVKDSGIYLSGNFNGTINFGGQSISTASQKAYVLKFDLNGNAITGLLGGQNTNGSYIDIDAFGNIYMGGNYYSTTNFGSLSITSVGSNDLYVTKYNISTSTWEWLRTFGGVGYEIAYAISVDESSNIFFNGVLGGNDVNFDGIIVKPAITNNSQQFTAKLNFFGEVKWVKKLGGVGHMEAVPSRDGNVFIFGNIGKYYGTPFAIFDNQTITTDSYDIYLSKFGNDGSFKWFSKYGSSGTDYMTSMKYKNNKIYILGSYENSLSIGSSNIYTSGIQMYLGVLYEP